MRTSQLTNLVLFISILTVSSCDKKSEIENQAPTCLITNPGNGVEIIQGQTVILSVEAIDSDGSVIDVIFSVDGHGIGISDTSPFRFDWNTTGVDTGRHTIKVTATDNEGSTATDEIVLFVIEEEEIGPPPLAAFTAGQTSVYLGSPIQFTDESTNDATSWNWEFGDGNTSSSQNPSHLYDATGTYTVSLTVTNNFGSDTLTELNYITVSVRVGASDILRDVRDGQIYKTIEIGGQVWMAENLNYEASSGSWVYDNDSSNASSFGRLYNWEPAIEVCPFGWHLPTDNEWKQLENAIGMSLEDVHNTGWRGTEEGSKLKANNGWNSNGNGTDEYGFNALPGGYRYNNGNFGHMDSYAFFWSSTSYAADYAYYRAFHYTIDKIDRFPFPKDYGFSIRCVRDF